MTENEIAKIIVDKSFKIHQSLEPGLLESVYERILTYELEISGLKVDKQVPIDICYENLVLKDSFRADLIIEDKVLVELKSVEAITTVNYKQTLSYLKLTGLHLGLLINFNEAYIKNGIRRIVNNLKEEKYLRFCAFA
jgi:GxxExxY protein